MKPGLLFDLDGTLADTDDLHFEAFNEMLEGRREPLTLADYKTQVMGRANADIFADLFPDLNDPARRELADRKELLFRRRLTGPLAPMPGLLALLDWAERRAIPAVIVSNAPRANCELMLAALGLAARFPQVVLAEDLARGKPDPLPYLTGLDVLGADPSRSMAFEDSPSGVRAAVAAGLPVIGIGSGAAAEALLSAGAALVATDFRDARVMEAVEARLAA